MHLGGGYRRHGFTRQSVRRSRVCRRLYNLVQQGRKLPHALGIREQSDRRDADDYGSPRTQMVLGAIQNRSTARQLRPDERYTVDERRGGDQVKVASHKRRAVKRKQQNDHRHRRSQRVISNTDETVSLTLNLTKFRKRTSTDIMIILREIKIEFSRKQKKEKEEK